MKPIKSLIISLSLIYCLFVTGCSSAQIDRAISIAQTIPGIITSLHLQNEGVALNLIKESINLIKVFRDNPTAGNYQNALAALDHALSSGVFHINPLLLGVIQALRVTFAAIIPQGIQSEMSPNSTISVDLKKADVDALKSKVEELKRSVK